jgi:hypothetical protein
VYLSSWSLWERGRRRKAGREVRPPSISSSRRDIVCTDISWGIIITIIIYME